jgi:hypothetical protein
VTPNARTANWLGIHGYRAGSVETRRGKYAHDLFGCWDGIAVGPGVTIAYQATVGSALANRREKLLEMPVQLRDCLAAGWVLLLLGWSKAGPKGKRKLWRPRIEQCRLNEDGVPVFEEIEDVPHTSEPWAQVA